MQLVFITHYIVIILIFKLRQKQRIIEKGSFIVSFSTPVIAYDHICVNFYLYKDKLTA